MTLLITHLFPIIAIIIKPEIICQPPPSNKI
jgi:hypothetical protein